MKIQLILVALICFIIIAANLSFASESADEKITSGLFSFGRSTSLIRKEGIAKSDSWDLAVSAKYLINKDWSAGLSLEGSQDLIENEKSDFSKLSNTESYLGLSNKNDVVLFTPSLSLGLPISKAQYSASFQGSAGIALKAVLNPDYLVSKKLHIEGSLAASRSFHKFETAANGKQNTQYTAVQNITLGWAFTEKLTLAVQGNHYHTWNYLGTMKEFYNHGEELAFAFNSRTSLAVGHQYGNPYLSVWKGDKQSYNLNISDDDNSIVYANLTIIL